MQCSEKVENIILEFSGYDSDRGIIDARELAISLQGWCEYWRITCSSFLNHELSVRPLTKDLAPKIKIKALKYNTFDIFTDVIMPLGLMISFDVLKKLFKWRLELFNRHIKNKREFLTKEQAVANIEKLANNFGVLNKNTLETIKFIDLADEALNNFAIPINYSAKKVSLKSSLSKQNLILSSKEKCALSSGYYTESSIASRELERVKVRFLRIHTQTGNAIVTFDSPREIHQMGHVFATIVDPIVKEPKNAYTKALYESTFLEVWGRKRFKKINNEFLHWEISKDLPTEDMPLLDDSVKKS